MPTINELTSINTVNDADQLPIYSQGQGDARKVAASVLRDYVADNLPPVPAGSIGDTEVSSISASKITASGGSGPTVFSTVAGFISRILSSVGASMVGYAPTPPLVSTNVQDALDELAAASVAPTAANVSYVPTSPLTATDVQGALDELAISGGSAANVINQFFSGDGVTTSFVLSSDPGTQNAVWLTVEDVPQRPGIDFTVTGTTLSFGTAPTTGTDNIFARWIATTTLNIPADGSVTTPKIADSNVTYDKIQDVPENTLLGGADTGGGTDVVRPITIGSNLTLSGGVLSASGGGGGGASGVRNKLFNPTFLVNQRQYVSGAATSGANQYTLDRWRVVTSGQNLSWSDSGNVRTVTAPAGGVEQVIEGNNLITGTYVISWTGTATCTVGGVAKASGDTVAVTGGSNLTIRFTNGTVVKPQFELGSTPTSFEDRPFGLELMLCQRYCYAVSSDDTVAVISYGYSSTTTAFQAVIPYTQKLRVSPTSVVVSNVAHFTTQTGAGALVSSAVTFSGASSTQAGVVAFTVSGAAANQPGFVYFNNAAGYLYFEGSEL